VLLAPVRALVVVAVGEPGVAGAVALTRRAGRVGDVAVRAAHPAPAAVARVGVDVLLAAVGLLVVVAVREPGVAGAVAHPRRAGRVADVGARADGAAPAAVLRVGAGRHLAAVGALVVVAVGEPGVAVAVALAARAAGRDVGVRA